MVHLKEQYTLRTKRVTIDPEIPGKWFVLLNLNFIELPPDIGIAPAPPISGAVASSQQKSEEKGKDPVAIAKLKTPSIKVDEPISEPQVEQEQVVQPPSGSGGPPPPPPPPPPGKGMRAILDWGCFQI